MSIKIRILSLKSISFAMSNASCALILLLSLFKDFFAKTLNDVRLDMGGKVFTAIESPILNRCDTIWDIYVSEGFAIVKSKLSNRCDTIWNIYVYEGFATPKSMLSNRCDTIWNIYAGERVAPHKSTPSNRCDTIWNIYADEGFTTFVFTTDYYSIFYR